MTDRVQQGFSDRDRRVVRNLLSDQPANRRIAAHRLVDRPVGRVDEIGQAAGQLPPITQSGLIRATSFEAEQVDSQPAVTRLRLPPEQKNAGQGRSAVVEEPEVPQPGAEVDPAAGEPASEVGQAGVLVELGQPGPCDDSILDRHGRPFDQEGREVVADQGAVRRAGSDQDPARAGLHEAAGHGWDLDDADHRVVDAHESCADGERRMRSPSGFLDPFVDALPVRDPVQLTRTAVAHADDDAPANCVRQCDHGFLQRGGTRCSA